MKKMETKGGEEDIERNNIKQLRKARANQN